MAAGGTQNNNQQFGLGTQNNHNATGTQNINYGRDQNTNNGPGAMNINNNERTGRDPPPPTQHPIAGSATRDRRGDAQAPSIAPAGPPSEKRLNGDKLRREEDAFRNMRDNEADYEEILGIKDEDARKTLDDWQLLIECTEDTKLRHQVVRAMRDLVYRSGQAPEVIWIGKVGNLSEHAVDFGGFADIWTGSTDGKKVAVKVVRYRIDREQRDQMMKAFMREAVIWKSFDHPNILPLMGMYWFNSEQICLVCPWMENGNLLQFVKTHPDINSATQEELAKEIAQGLAYLHGLNITHGDLKGYNVLIDVDPDDPDRIAHARITDFGLSRVADDENLAGLSAMSGRQGPARWLAPELLTKGRKSAISLKSDVYAFGCVCYEIYAKRIPFEDIEEHRIYQVIVEQGKRLQPPPDMDNKMRDLMQLCCEADPNSRPDATQIVEQIERPTWSRSEPARPIARARYLDRNK
ncbi:Receptor-interacting serine/threonine-protein kinase 1 [Marasmius tenuissimus]|nr:Receptor-interacting serine/threonine-protein kinase 1 [Marasmius tenuissimus]